MADGKPMETDDVPSTTAARDKETGSAKTAEKEGPKPVTVQDSLRAIVHLIENCVKTKDTRLLAGRLHRSTASIRAQLTPAVLSQFVQQYLVGSDAAASRTFLLEQLEQVRVHVCLGPCSQLRSPLADSPMQDSAALTCALLLAWRRTGRPCRLRLPVAKMQCLPPMARQQLHQLSLRRKCTRICWHSPTTLTLSASTRCAWAVCVWVGAEAAVEVGR